MGGSYFKMGKPEEDQLPSIYDQIGGSDGVAHIVRKAVSLRRHVRYCIREYSELFKDCHTSDGLFMSHQDKYNHSKRFRKRCLNFDVVEKILYEKYEIPKREEIYSGEIGSPSREGWGKGTKDHSKGGWRKFRKGSSKKIWFRMPEYPSKDFWDKLPEYLPKEGLGKAPKSPSKNIWNKKPENPLEEDPWFQTLEELSKDGERKA